MPEENKNETTKEIGAYVSIEDVMGDPAVQAMVKAGFTVTAYMGRKAVDAITADTPRSIIKRKGKFDYVPHVYYRQKLAQAYGFDYDWEPEITVDWEHKLAFAKGKLTVRYRDPLTGNILGTRISWGADAVTLKEFSSGSGFVDVGNDMKAADSEAFKRAVMNLGFFSDLYVPEGRLTLDEAEDAEEKSRQAGGSGKVVEGTARKVQNPPEDQDEEPHQHEETRQSSANVTFVCADCKNTVTPQQLAGGTIAKPAQIVQFSQSRYKKNLCYSCTQARLTFDKEAAAQKAAAASVSDAVKRAEETVDGQEKEPATT